MADLKQVICDMMTENTGRALLDSGDHYGRNWQRNQGLTPEILDKRAQATLEIDVREYDGKEHVDLMPVVDIYHHLTQVLFLDGLCNEFNAMPVDDWNADLYGVSTGGEEWLQERFEIGNAWNTYNWDNQFSQVLQGYDLVHRDTDERYVLLQVHGGCDVRGGYTDAKLFEVAGEYAVVDDDCSFWIDAIEGQDTEMSLEWRGEWITREGTGADDEYLMAFAKRAGAAVGEKTVRLEGDCYRDPGSY